MLRNIVFILVDALRKDMVGRNGRVRTLTPNIDRLANEGLSFTNAFACTNTTDSSLTSIFTGLYPQRHGIVSHGERVTQSDIRNLDRVVLLPENLQKFGYFTVAIDWLGGWHKRGYEVYADPKKYKLFKRRIPSKIVNLISRELIRKFGRFYHPYPNGKLVTDVAIRLIKEWAKFKGRPLFLFIHYWDTHAPYFVPWRLKLAGSPRIPIESLIERMGSDNWNRHPCSSLGVKSVDELIARYLYSVNYVDSQIGRIVDFLEEIGIYDDSIVIVTSDHGESLTEHDIYFDHHGLYDVSVHVPLIIRGPELPKNKIIGSLVQHVDIVPTIYEILNLRSNQPSDGYSLLNCLRGANEVREAVFLHEAYTQNFIAIRTKKFKFITAIPGKAIICRYCGKIHGGEEQLYDLEHDPLEKVNVADKLTDCKEKFKKDLFLWFEKLKSSPLEGRERKRNLLPMSDTEENEVLDRLRRLGYF